MSTIMPHGRGNSPFDAIMHTDDQGEHTTGRELMPLVGYSKWEHFNDAVEMAYHVILAEQGKTAADQHFSRYREKGTGGRPRDNVRLTRYAAYLTAMRGDSRKPEIRAALIYFAVQTRIAETMGSVQSAPSPEPLALEPGKPVPQDLNGSMVCVTPDHDGPWIDGPDITAPFCLRDSDELAAWLPEDERKQITVSAGGDATMRLWVVSRAGLARLLSERPMPSLHISRIRREALHTWADRDCPVLPPPSRRELT